MGQVDIGPTMTTSVAEILHLVETLAHLLMEPVDELPAMSERPWDVPRGLDSLGVHGGDPDDELLALGRALRQGP
jgi:hypothetical protein